ncbi:hypothetical protein, partial [Treponema pedis]|uniref:hypothetical protein n=1 Tax=Treponema pedis TaxID=409322 RepID=UPI00056EFE15
MSNVSYNIISLFSSSFELTYEIENCDEMIAIYEVKSFNKTLSQQNIWEFLNTRDQIAIHVYEDDVETISYISNPINSWNDFINNFRFNNIQHGRVKIHISKHIKENYLSVYDINNFTKYINELSLSQFLEVINNRFNDFLVFENQDENYPQWSTNTITFIPKNATCKISSIESIIKENRINNARKLCYSEIKKYNLIPEDLYCSEIDATNSLQTTFFKACIIYMCSFIFDYSILKNDIYEYKINGFKTLTGKIETKIISNIEV